MHGSIIIHPQLSSNIRLNLAFVVYHFSNNNKNKAKVIEIQSDIHSSFIYKF